MTTFCSQKILLSIILIANEAVLLVLNCCLFFLNQILLLFLINFLLLIEEILQLFLHLKKVIWISGKYSEMSWDSLKLFLLWISRVYKHNRSVVINMSLYSTNCLIDLQKCIMSIPVLEALGMVLILLLFCLSLHPIQVVIRNAYYKQLSTQMVLEVNPFWELSSNHH